MDLGGYSYDMGIKEQSFFGKNINYIDDLKNKLKQNGIYFYDYHKPLVIDSDDY
jgi:hypothetical protein